MWTCQRTSRPRQRVVVCDRYMSPRWEARAEPALNLMSRCHRKIIIHSSEGFAARMMERSPRSGARFEWTSRSVHGAEVPAESSRS